LVPLGAFGISRECDVATIWLGPAERSSQSFGLARKLVTACRLLVSRRSQPVRRRCMTTFRTRNNDVEAVDHAWHDRNVARGAQSSTQLLVSLSCPQQSRTKPREEPQKDVTVYAVDLSKSLHDERAHPSPVIGVTRVLAPKGTGSLIGYLSQDTQRDR